jgi:transcriptional regulator of nitric oxide reductase
MTRPTLLDVVTMGGPPVILLVLVVGYFFYTQSAIDSALDARNERELSRVFPEATRFSAHEGEPPYIRAFASSSQTGEEILIGLTFYTFELEPFERGYDGPIKMLVGMTLEGRLTTIEVLEHSEPYGYFSIETRAFQEQFVGKRVVDPFRIGDDIDAVSRATLTVSSAARAIRNSARRVARAYLGERAAAP